MSIALLGVNLSVAADATTAAPAATTAPAATIAAAGETNCTSCLTCPCGCSPLAGAWVAKLECDCSWGKDTILQTFKFAPLNDGCTKFVVNSQSVTRLAKVAKFWPDACDQTEFVGIACKDEWKNIKLTAISYGVKRCATTTRAARLIAGASGETTTTSCPTTTDKVVFIAVMTVQITLPEDCLTCGADQKDASGNYTGECKEPKQLSATVFISFFDAAQDADHDGFPDSTCDEPVLCVRCETCLKRVELMEPCDAQTKNFVACLGPCKENNKDVNTPATGRAFVTIDEAEQDVDVVVTVQDIKDVTKVALQINGADVLILLQQPKDGDCEGLLLCKEFPIKDFIGSLKGKKLADLLKAIEEGKVTVVVSTKYHPKGEICGTVEDP